MPIVQYTDVNHNLPTPKEIREMWCFGLPLYAKQSTQWTAAGQVMKDTDIQNFINSAIQETERKLGVFLKPTAIKCQYTAYMQNLKEGTDYDLLEPAYDYIWDQANNWGFLQVRQYPFLSIEGFKLVLPNNQTVLDFGSDRLGGLPPNPISWIKPYPKVGQIQLVPYSGISSVFYVGGGAGSYGQLAVGGNLWSQNLPQALWLDYTAGFALGKVPADVRNIVAKMAAVDALGIAGEALLAGIASQSTSMDGLSESFTTTASAENGTYTAHVRQYQAEIDGFFREGGGSGNGIAQGHGGARTYYKGFNFTVL